MRALAEQSSKLGFGIPPAREPREGATNEELAKLELRSGLQSESQEHQLARQSSNFGLWPNFQSDAARCETATPKNLNLWPRLQPEHGGNQPAG